ncbi:hypothetical protein LEP1GSC199_2027 [Leptospira vanthielii serovar Holland str. Waz Holland = ATCC 700522]|uniref:Uncharacterized protein n=2 Tax=Leptospira TaxID=171 RepID=N1W7T6_9LEPT|nr:hypothetical protein LEP1GSC199_2027 [Leptospira vanthielii serovar Holland str. Waz Holland = ATCC 700522]
MSPGQGGKTFSRKFEKQKKPQSTTGGNSKIRVKKASNCRKSNTKEKICLPVQWQQRFKKMNGRNP